MHPPLDRPHPDCQQEIHDLQECNAKRFAKFIGGCDQIDIALRKCFQLEKAKMLKELNKDMFQKRALEDEAIREATGRKMTFDDYLKQDADYQRELKKASSRPAGVYQAKANGGIPTV